MPRNKLQMVACQPYVYEIIGCLHEKLGQTQQSQEPNLNVQALIEVLLIGVRPSKELHDLLVASLLS